MEAPPSAPDEAHESFVRIMEILASGEHDLVAVIEAYFDESASSGVLGVAGYLFEKDACGRLDLAWKEALDRHGLKYFHMVECTHGNKTFKKLDKPTRIALASEMIQLIRTHSLFGTAFAIVESDYNDLFPDGKPLGDPYTYCCWAVLSTIHAWVIQNFYDGDIAYFFEAGHIHQPQANAIMNRLFHEPNLRDQYRY